MVVIVVEVEVVLAVEEIVFGTFRMPFLPFYMLYFYELVDRLRQ